jgi:methyl-accepting chemotaxis protein
MNNDNQVQEAFEQLQNETDQHLSYVLFVSSPLVFILGSIYGQPVFALSGVVFCGGIFLVAKNYIQDRVLKTAVSSSGFILFIAMLTFACKGLTEARYFYFMFLFSLVLYQSSTPIHVASCIAYVYVLLSFMIPLTESKFSYLIYEYMLEKQNVSIERFAFTFVSVAVTHITALFIADNLRRRTLNNFKANFQQKEQLQVLERNLNFANEIASGNLDVNYELQEQDLLGKSLVTSK